MKRCVFVLAVVICVVSIIPAHSDERAYIVGEFKDGVYTNRAIGAELSLDDKWRVLSPEEIAAINGVLKSAKGLSESEKELPAFYAVSNQLSDTICITISEMDADTVDFFNDPDNISIVDALMESWAINLRDFNAELGIDSTIECIRTNFLGENHPGLLVKTMLSETRAMYQKQILCYRDGHQFQVSVISKGRDITDEMLSMFHKINY